MVRHKNQINKGRNLKRVNGTTVRRDDFFMIGELKRGDSVRFNAISEQIRAEFARFSFSDFLPHSPSIFIQHTTSPLDSISLLHRYICIYMIIYLYNLILDITYESTITFTTETDGLGFSTYSQPFAFSLFLAHATCSGSDSDGALAGSDQATKI